MAKQLILLSILVIVAWFWGASRALDHYKASCELVGDNSQQWLECEQ